MPVFRLGRARRRANRVRRCFILPSCQGEVRTKLCRTERGALRRKRFLPKSGEGLHLEDSSGVRVAG